MVQAQFNYTTENGTITITGYTGPGGAVAIPDTINGRPVTSIGGFESTSLTSVTIPNSVTNIGPGAFAHCPSLGAITVGALNSSYSSVDGVLFNKSQTLLIQYPGGKAGSFTIPNSVTSIGYEAFYYCTSLSSVTIPNSVTSIGVYAFYSCTSLTSVTIPNTVTSIGHSTFYSCTSLTNVTIPNSVTSIGDYAFRFCTSLTSVTIPSSATSIGNYAFHFCTGLTSVTIPNSVTSIGGSAFSDCTSLSAITVDALNSVYSSVDGGLFNKSQTLLIQCPGGKAGNYTIPNGVTSIGGGAFGNCTSLTNVTIPNTVASIGSFAFYSCASLTRVTIPNSVTSIEDYAFRFCTSLSAITVDGLNSFYSSLDGVLFNKSQNLLIQCPGGKAGSYTIRSSVTSIGSFAFGSCTSLTSVTIPNSVTSIGDYAFNFCTSLSSITIPDSVTSIGDGAFSYCTNLTRVYFQGNAPSVVYDPWDWKSEGVFGGSDNATVYYLPGTTGWETTFANRPTALWALPYPVILNSGPSFGVQSNAFGFVISWATNISVVVEASTSLANPAWVPVRTNTLTGGSSYFSDPQWTNHPVRFYRLRSP